MDEAVVFSTLGWLGPDAPVGGTSVPAGCHASSGADGVACDIGRVV